MFSIISEEDSKIMSNARFVKNAVLYKDMLAFYALYEEVMKAKKQSLPNFVFTPKGEYCLEGICLIAKNYSSELGFETLNLSLDYLKTIYYTLAGYADENGKVDKKLIVAEFEEYKKASKASATEISSETKAANEKYQQSKSILEKASNSYAKNLVTAKAFNVLYLFFLIAGFMSAMVPFSFYFVSKITIIKTVIIAAVCLVIGLAISYVFKLFEKRLTTKSNDIAYSMQMLKKNRDNDFLVYKDIRDKENKILSEKYEYENQFFAELSRYGKTLSMKEIFALASEYKLVSYNYKKDITKIFADEQSDAENVIYEIGALRAGLDSSSISDLYARIKQKDWLYYNNQVRFHFINRFITRAEKTKEWTVATENGEENPFGINIKKLAKEEIAYLKSEDGLFIASSLDKFLSTKFAKNLKDFEIKNKSNYEDLKNLKVQYMKHFYDYNSVKDYNNLFYDRKFTNGVAISEEILEKDKKIPSLIALKIKLLEDKIGYGNSGSAVIKQISNLIAEETFVEEDEEIPAALETVFEDYNISEFVYDDPAACESAEILEDGTVRYVSGGKVIIGEIITDTVE